VAKTNVEMTLAEIRARSSVLSELEKAGTIKMVGAMYNLKTAVVQFYV
jgi:carbonic anhydrase